MSTDRNAILEEAAVAVLVALVPGRTDKLELHWVAHNAATMHAAEVIRALKVPES